MTMQELAAKRRAQAAQKPSEAVSATGSTNISPDAQKGSERLQQGNTLLTGKPYREMYRDIYTFHMNFFRPRESLNWDIIAAEAVALCEKYDNDRFVVDMVALIYSEIEELNNDRKQD